MHSYLGQQEKQQILNVFKKLIVPLNSADLQSFYWRYSHNIMSNTKRKSFAACMYGCIFILNKNTDSNSIRNSKAKLKRVRKRRKRQQRRIRGWGIPVCPPTTHLSSSGSDQLTALSVCLSLISRFSCVCFGFCLMRRVRF